MRIAWIIGAAVFTSLLASAQTRPVITSVTTAYGGPVIAQNDWIVIKGTNLAPISTPSTGAIWNNAPEFAFGRMPTQLDNVSLTVNGKAAFIYFVCSANTDPACASDQINALSPFDPSQGSIQIVLTNAGTSSAPFTVNMLSSAPSFLLWGKYIVATHAGGSLLGPITLYPGLSTPAKPGETITLWAVGFGLPTTSLVNGSSAQSGRLPATPMIQIGGIQAAISFAGLVSPGLYQFNVTVPPNAAAGDDTVVASYGGFTTPAGEFIAVSGSAPVPAPTINSFTASPASIQSAQSAILSWSVSDATSVSIDNGIGSMPSTGTVTLKPAGTTTYTLTATSAGGTRTATAQVTVTQPACTTAPRGGSPIWNSDIVQFTGDLSQDASHWEGFSVNAQTTVVFKSVSDYSNQAAIITPDQLTNFKNGNAFTGFAIFDGTYGSHPVTLAPGSYYAAVRYFGNGSTHVRFELDGVLQVPGASFVDNYLSQAVSVGANGGILWQPFTIQCGFRYLLDGLNAGVEMYIIDASQLDNFKNNRTFLFYSAYSGGAGVIDEDQPDDYELKLLPGDYYLVYRNPAGNAKDAVYVMSRWQ